MTNEMSKSPLFSILCKKKNLKKSQMLRRNIHSLAPYHPDIIGDIKLEQLKPTKRIQAWFKNAVIRRCRFPRGSDAFSTDLEMKKITSVRTYNILVILFGFQNQEFTKKVPDIEKIFFANTKSVASYFDEISEGLIKITGKVVGPYKLDNTQKHYANGKKPRGGGIHRGLPNAKTMAKDALDKLKAKNPNFDLTPFVSDHSTKIVDRVVFMHAGKGREQTKDDADIHSHHFSFGRHYDEFTGGKIRQCVTVPEESAIGLYCHELGHLLFNLPDLYDVSYSGAGVGDWCLMSTGCWNTKTSTKGERPAYPSAYAKAMMGLVNVREVKVGEKQNISLTEVKTSKEILKIVGNPSNKEQFFLAEYREKNTKTFDAALPGQGLLIWHIDSNTFASQDCSRKNVALEQADGDNHLETASGNEGDDSDPFPGSRRITHFGLGLGPKKTPNSNYNVEYGERKSGVIIDSISISASGGQINFILK